MQPNKYLKKKKRNCDYGDISLSIYSHSKLKVHNGLSVITMYQCSSINCNILITLVGDVFSVGGLPEGWGQGAAGIEKSVLSTQFFCEPKTALKGKVYLKIIIFKMVPMVKIYVMCLVV